MKKVLSKSKYVVNDSVNIPVKYQIRNGQVIIGIKDVIDTILDKEEISKYKTDNISVNIPFDLNKQVTGNTINLVLDKKRFIIRLEAVEILPSKQQKIDYDNTHVHRWSIPQWVKFIQDLFYQTYGIRTIEMDLTGTHNNYKRGKVYGQIKIMIAKILNVDPKFSNKDIMHYLRWSFMYKSKKATLSLGLLNADTMIQEWLVYRKKREKKTGDASKERKWKSLQKN